MEGFETDVHSNFRETLGESGGKLGGTGGKLVGKALKDAILQ